MNIALELCILPKLHASFNREQSSLPAAFVFVIFCCDDFLKETRGNLDEQKTTETNLIPLYW